MAGLSQENPLKNVFNMRVVQTLAGNIKQGWPGFQEEKFVAHVREKLDQLGFIERSHFIRQTLKAFLPDDYPTAIRILLSSLGLERQDPGKSDWDSFIIMPICDYVSNYGKEHYDLSMHALHELTQRLSAEGDLRTFLDVDYEKTMKILTDWCFDESPHVRRLVSEGTRPRLPLNGRIKRFQKDPRPVLALLERLKDDPELYVRRSVANNINDIAKDNPDLAIETLKRWNGSKDKNAQWVVRHAARSLLKQGNFEVLELLGYKTDLDIRVNDFKLSQKSYKMGDILRFQFELVSGEASQQTLMVDYLIHYSSANGKMRQKLFKMRDIKAESGYHKVLSKDHRLRDTSGRKHYPGKQLIELQINGKRFGKLEFEIVS